MDVAITAPRILGIPVPSARTLLHLFIGGFVGLMLWEVWARFLTPVVLGGPLEPAGLVTSLGQRLFGIELPRLGAEAIHYLIGIVGYPVLYYLISRGVPRFGVMLDVVVLAVFTIFIGARVANGSFVWTDGLFWLVVSAFIASRFVNPSKEIADYLSWGTFTWINALGVMAPIAGLPFLLLDWGGGLSFMSWAGHVIFGAVLAYVFEQLERRNQTAPAPVM